ncbi:MAG: SIMPL domain-containing protein [Bdellovibrionota bacterium]
MKKIFLLLALILTPSAFAAENFRYISVRGEGEIKVKPDLATVQLVTHTKAKDAKSAQAKNAKEMARVMAVLKDEYKVEPKDILTSGFRVNPDYKYENNKQIFLGYVVDHDLTVTFRKLEKLGDLLDGIVGKGTEDIAVQLQGITFDTEKRKEVEVQALELAMKNAQARGEALAHFAKKPIRGVLRISDSSVNYQPFRPVMAKMMSADAVPGAAEHTQISQGEISVSSNVAVDYEIE